MNELAKAKPKRSNSHSSNQIPWLWSGAFSITQFDVRIFPESNEKVKEAKEESLSFSHC